MDAAQVVVAVAVAVTALDAISYAARGPSVLRSIYRSTPRGRRSRLFKELAKLAPGIQIGYVTEVLGEPAFKNLVGQYTEYIYAKPDCYVQVLADDSDSIVLFAVTAGSEHFHIPTWVSHARWSPRPQVADARLGKFTFNEVAGVDNARQGMSGWLGARRFNYLEVFYFGNPGNYLTYLLGVNDAGWVWRKDLLRRMKDGFGDYMLGIGTMALPETEGGEEVMDGPDWEDTRSSIASWLQRPETVEWREIHPNTFAVAGPNFNVGEQARKGQLPVGPNADQVRLLPSTESEWQWNGRSFMRRRAGTA